MARHLSSYLLSAFYEIVAISWPYQLDDDADGDYANRGEDISQPIRESPDLTNKSGLKQSRLRQSSSLNIFQRFTPTTQFSLNQYYPVCSELKSGWCSALYAGPTLTNFSYFHQRRKNIHKVKSRGSSWSPCMTIMENLPHCQPVKFWSADFLPDFMLGQIFGPIER